MQRIWLNLVNEDWNGFWWTRLQDEIRWMSWNTQKRSSSYLNYEFRAQSRANPSDYIRQLMLHFSYLFTSFRKTHAHTLLDSISTMEKYFSTQSLYSLYCSSVQRTCQERRSSQGKNPFVTSCFHAMTCFTLMARLSTNKLGTHQDKKQD